VRAEEEHVSGRRQFTRPAPGGRRASAGFGLIEALVAAGILGFAMLAFQASTITLTRGEKEADSTAVATALAQQRLELLRSLPLGDPRHTPGTYADPSNPLTADGQPNGRYTVTWQVSNRDVPDFGLKTILVNVAWNDPRPRTMRLGAFVRCTLVPCP
jgi:type II secretory pathway pseudopilin PulG